MKRYLTAATIEVMIILFLIFLPAGEIDSDNVWVPVFLALCVIAIVFLVGAEILAYSFNDKHHLAKIVSIHSAKKAKNVRKLKKIS